MTRRSQKRTKVMPGALVCAAAVLSFSVLSFPAEAQSAVDADFSRYCREKFSNSAYERRTERWGIEHYCIQGGTPQNIDFAEACRMTTGSPEFRKDGMRILCTGNAPPETTAESGPPDFQAYCSDKFPNSSYESRAEEWGVVHYCRRPGATGGFTLQQIDLADACRVTRGTPEFRKDGNRVICGATMGTYVFPQMGFTYHGPLKNGLPHGVGWMKIPPTASTWVGEYREGKLVGPHLQRRNGTLQCWDYDRFAPGKVLPELPLSRCAHLREKMATIP